MTHNTNDEYGYVIVVSVPKKEKRAQLFKVIDARSNRPEIIAHTESKRIITPKLFDSIQGAIDSSKFARVSLVRQIGEDEFKPIVTDATPRDSDYNEILRRLRQVA